MVGFFAVEAVRCRSICILKVSRVSLFNQFHTGALTHTFFAVCVCVENGAAQNKKPCFNCTNTCNYAVSYYKVFNSIWMENWREERKEKICRFAIVWTSNHSPLLKWRFKNCFIALRHAIDTFEFWIEKKAKCISRVRVSCLCPALSLSRFLLISFYICLSPCLPFSVHFSSCAHKIFTGAVEM